MKKKLFFALAGYLFLCTSIYAQNKEKNSTGKSNNPPVLVINKEDTTYLDEFLAVYNKNSHLGEKQSLEDYMQLFVNFKLKVYEAKKMGLDTMPAFLAELKTYRTQLAQPYLNDKEVSDKLLKEAYDRMQYDVRAAHILVRCPENASPADTLECWKRIMKIRERIVKDKEPFELVAREESEDPSVKENGGDLGYFNVFYMVYPFETAAYTTPVGEVSMPVRTRFGYHLVYVKDKRPARGQIKVAHIMKRFPVNATEEDKQKAKEKIFEIYNRLKNGESFEELAKTESDDKSTSLHGGVLPVFGTGRMVESFEDAAFALKKDGDISEPVETPYGWHIIKRLEKYDLKPFEDMKAELKQKMAKDSRTYLSKESFVNRLKKEYGYKEYPQNLKDIYTLVNKDIFEAKWKKPADLSKYNKPVFELNGRKYTQEEFIEYMYKMQYRKPVTTIAQVVNEYFKEFVKETVLKIEDENLEKKYPEFARLYKEYYEGILLFNITDRMVWSKAVKDTAGLKAFYEENKNKYLWDERVDAVIFESNDMNVLTKFKKAYSKMVKKGKDGVASLLAKYNKKSEVIKIHSGLYLKGENPLLNPFEWTEGISEIASIKDKFVFVHIKKIVPPSPKDFNLVKGAVISDYQQYLEKKWLDDLKQKYPVEVFYENLKNVNQQ